MDSNTRNASKSRNILKQYYGNYGNNDTNDSNQLNQTVCDPFDMKSAEFNSEMFINKVIYHMFICLIVIIVIIVY